MRTLMDQFKTPKPYNSCQGDQKHRLRDKPNEGLTFLFCVQVVTLAVSAMLIVATLAIQVFKVYNS